MHTKAQVIEGRLEGLHSFDEALKYISLQLLVEQAIEMHNKVPNFQPTGWKNIDWVFGGMWRTVLWIHDYYPDEEIPSTANLDECLPEYLILQISERTGIVPPYRPTWPRAN